MAGEGPSGPPLLVLQAERYRLKRSLTLADERRAPPTVPVGSPRLGAIRMATGCMKCHDGNRGDLLGAFTYELVRDPAFVKEEA
jgi:hypothetical protein